MARSAITKRKDGKGLFNEEISTNKNGKTATASLMKRSALTNQSVDLWQATAVLIAILHYFLGTAVSSADRPLGSLLSLQSE